MSAVTFKKDQAKQSRFRKWFSFLFNPNSEFYYFWMLVVVGIFFFCVSLFTNYFTTPFTGDYTSQVYAFYTNEYDDWWHFLKTGEFILYDTNTFLGASNIGSNAFYCLFDPLFLPLLLFPRAIIPQAIAILTILKMALGGLFFSKYMEYLGVKKFTARLAGLMYAFCGWVSWYLWFHFPGVAAIFPLILFGVEKVLKEKKPWLLAFSLFMMGLSNFFFFFTFVICAFLYAGFRFFQNIRTYKVKEAFAIIGVGFVGFLIGCLLASVVVIPATYVALTAPRAVAQTYLPNLLEALKNWDLKTVFKILFVWDEGVNYRVYYPVIDFIFPVMSDRGTPLTKLGNETYDNVAGSLFAYSPCVIFLIPALISSAKKKHFGPLIATALFTVMLFTPFSYYAFHGFTNAYSRWTLFVTTSLIAYVSFYIDDIKNQPKWHVLVGGGFALIMGGLAIYFAVYMANTYEDFKLRYVYNELGPYGFLIIEGVLFLLYVAVLTALLYIFLYKKQVKTIFTFSVIVEALIMGALVLNGHGYENYMNVNNGYSNNVAFQRLIDEIKKDDPTYYRCYSSQENPSARNDSMRHDYNGLGMFHSLYNFNDAAFLNWSQINDYPAPGSYSASYVEKRQDLDTFLGIKYYFVNKNIAFWGDKKAQDLKYQYYRVNAPIGFVDISDKYPNSNYFVYENQNFIDFAFSYDQVATYNNITETGEVSEPTTLYNYTYENEDLYLKAAIVGENNLKYVSGLIPEANIRDVSQFKSELDVRTVPKSYYKVTYYDIHGDAEQDREEGFEYYFVSKLLDLSGYPSTTKKPEEWKYNGRYVTVIETNPNFPYDEEGIALYLRNNYLDKNDINLYLTTLGEDGKDRFVTFDNHNDTHVTINWTSRKNWRGVYSAPSYDENGNKVPAPKINKIILAARKTNLENYTLAYKTGTDVNKVIQNHRDYPITDINYRTNHFDFKTNYDARRVIVTQLPYEPGWSVKATLADGTEKKIDVFTAQGGYVSFVSEVGAVSYSLDFYTPYLKLGSYLSSIGLFMFASTMISYLYISVNLNNQKYKNFEEYRRNSVKYQIF